MTAGHCFQQGGSGVGEVLPGKDCVWGAQVCALAAAAVVVVVVVAVAIVGHVASVIATACVPLPQMPSTCPSPPPPPPLFYDCPHLTSAFNREIASGPKADLPALAVEYPVSALLKTPLLILPSARRNMNKTTIFHSIHYTKTVLNIAHARHHHLPPCPPSFLSSQIQQVPPLNAEGKAYANPDSAPLSQWKTWTWR